MFFLYVELVTIKEKRDTAQSFSKILFSSSKVQHKSPLLPQLMNHYFPFSLREVARLLVILPIVLLTACVTLSPEKYSPINTTIGETTEWHMPLNSEPGQVRLKLQIPRQGVTRVALSSDHSISDSLIRISFSGNDCSTGPEAQIKFYTSNTESQFRYFRAPLQWDDEINLAISWDKNAVTSVTVNKETLTVQAHVSFTNIRVSNNYESIKIKEMAYTPLPKSTAIEGRTTQGQTQ